MPKITELDSVISLDGNDVLPIVSKNNNNEDETMKVAINLIGTKLLNSNEYGALITTDKKIIGAINEVNGKAKENLSDLTDTTITTPSNADLLAYDSTTSKWVNTDLKGTASGSIATFSNGGNDIPVSEFECDIVATGGGGTPDSPIAINGFSQADITVTDNDQISNVYVVSFGQTIYGGRLIYANGQWSIEVTQVGELMTNLTWSYDSGVFRTVLPNAITPIADGDTQALCSMFKTVNYPNSDDNIYWVCDLSYSSGKYACVKTTQATDLPTFQSLISGQYMTYTLATPVIIPITSSTRVKTISGTNKIYHNGNGDISVNYFTDKADNIAELIKAFL